MRGYLVVPETKFLHLIFIGNSDITGNRFSTILSYKQKSSVQSFSLQIAFANGANDNWCSRNDFNNMKKIILVVSLGLLIIGAAILLRYSFGGTDEFQPEGAWFGTIKTKTIDFPVALKLGKTKDGKYSAAVFQNYIYDEVSDIKGVTVEAKGVSFNANFYIIGSRKCQLQWKDQTFKSLTGKCRTEGGDEEPIDLTKSTSTKSDVNKN